MKSEKVAAALLTGLTAASPAFAVDTSQVYNSGFLVLAFVGFCALVIVAQIVPAAVLFTSAIKAVVSLLRERKAVKAEEKS